MIRNGARALKGPAATLLEGDALDILKTLPTARFGLIISSPPYNIGKRYERTQRLSFDQYLEWQDSIIDCLVKLVADTGSICWQVGSHVKDGELYPLDLYFYNSFKKRGMQLRNRIMWRFNFGLNSTRRFSGRYEIILWFTKSDRYKFNLDPVRIPQIYPGKRHPANKGINGGAPSGNRLGKNPSDHWEFSSEAHFRGAPVWEIPNVKANHPEKTSHPCQFPVELVERCVLALTDEADTVLDPFVGTGTSVIAAIKHGRHAIGIDKDPLFMDLARARVRSFQKGELRLRPIGRAIHRPRPTEMVSQIPKEWLTG